MSAFNIEITHFYEFEYSECNRKITLEADFREPFLELSKSQIQKWDDSNDVIDENERNHIYNNIVTYFKEKFPDKNIIVED